MNRRSSRSKPGQIPGERPAPWKAVELLPPCGRIPASLIIDDSTCLVNLNRFAMPQFDQAYGGNNPLYHKDWRQWPLEIPDSFVRRFGEWAAAEGVKGKYSIVPFPACVGRLDRFLPGWTARELADSLELVRTVMTPNWDIHPEMITHTRVLDLKTGQPYSDPSLSFMENWDWSAGKSTDELTAYLVYALQILKNVGFRCEGVTSPGSFGSRARPEYAQAALLSLREVFGVEIPHYFRDMIDRGGESVAPRVEHASGIDGPDPRCVVSILACTGDWTGGWDNTTPQGADKFITADLKSGRMVEVIERGEPAIMLAHWTGVYWNGRGLGFTILQEVIRRLQTRFDCLKWMKLEEIARYWAARELTRIESAGEAITLQAPFACPDFTIRYRTVSSSAPCLQTETATIHLKEVKELHQLASPCWHRQQEQVTACFALPRGKSILKTGG